MLYYDYEWIYNKHISKEDEGLREFNKIESKYIKKKETSRDTFTIFFFLSR